MTTRRTFLQTIGVATAVPLVPAVAAGSTGTRKDAATDPARKPQAALFQQQRYIDFDSMGEYYAPPPGNHANATYRASLTAEEFLRRHWFH